MKETAKSLFFSYYITKVFLTIFGKRIEIACFFCYIDKMRDMRQKTKNALKTNEN